MSYYGKIAIAKLNEKDEKENKMDVESIVKGLRKKELEKAGFDKKTIDYLSKQKNNTEDEKENASVQDKFSHKGCLITILKKGEGKYTFTITKDGREEGTNNVYSTQDAAERDAKKEVDMVWNSDEEKSYYAKIVEQKKERKNYKFTDKEIADYLRSNPSYAKQYVRKKTNGKAENITIHPENLTAELEENGKTYVFKFVADESVGFVLKYVGTK